MQVEKPSIGLDQFSIKSDFFINLDDTLRQKFLSRRLPDSQWILASFLLGVTVPLFSQNLLPLELLWTLFLTCFFLACRWRLATLLLAFVLGSLHVTSAFRDQQTHVLPDLWQKKDIPLSGRVVGLPKTDQNNVRFKFEIDKVTLDSGPQSLKGKHVQLSCYRCPITIETGQSWSWTVRLKKPRGYASSGAFDYEKHLFRNKTVATGYVRTNEEYYESPVDHGIRGRGIDHYRAYFRASLDQLLSDSSVGNHFIKALVIGDKSAFSAEERNVLQKAGLSHLVAISGLHIGLMFFCTVWVVGCLFNRFSFLYEYITRQNLVVLPAWLVAITYSALAGFSVSTQRAMLMLSIYVVVRLLARETSILRVLILTAVIVLLIDPLSVLDGGFWLSFTAVLIIAILNMRSKNISLWKMQLALWVGMMPLNSMMFGHISLVSPVINLLAVPLFSLFIIPVTLLVSICAVALDIELVVDCLKMLSLLFEQLILGLGFINEHITMVVFTGSSAAFLCAGCFACFLCILQRRYVMTMLALPTLYLGVATSLSLQEHTGFKLWLLDVGQGLSIVYRTQNGVSIYDTGPRYQSGFSAANAVVIPFIEHLGVDRINRLIVSHADNDHIGGAPEIMKRFHVEQVMTSRVDKFHEAKECQAGQTWTEGETEFTVLSPGEQTPSGSNNLSCVLKISHQGVSILLSGDIEKKVERHLLGLNVDLSADVLLVPHQGSKTSSIQPFIEAVDPQFGLIAAGYLNHYGHPHIDVVDRYRELNVKLLSTIEMGTIELGIDRGHLEYSGYRQTQRRPWHWRETNPSIGLIEKLP